MYHHLFIIQCTYVINSSAIIRNIQDICQTGLAVLAMFYFDFREAAKQDERNFLSSILTQLCHQSDKFSQVLASVYLDHGDGSREPSVDVLLECLKAMVSLPGQGTIYIVVDALDESPNSSGLPTQREQVLETLKVLIDTKLPHLRFCITSRPELDIRRVLEPLSPYNVSLHEQDGQRKDVARYVESVVNSDPVMRNWPPKTKALVIDTLAEDGGGMYVDHGASN